MIEANQNPDWVCPVCRGICNCSLCLRGKVSPIILRSLMEDIMVSYYFFEKINGRDNALQHTRTHTNRYMDTYLHSIHSMGIMAFVYTVEEKDQGKKLTQGANG